MIPAQTPSQTIGPFFKPALIRTGQESLITPKSRGERITIEGRVLDGDSAPVSDAMIELWQANADGRYDHPEDSQEKLLDPDFHGFGRAATDEGGLFASTRSSLGLFRVSGLSCKRRTSISRFLRAGC